MFLEVGYNVLTLHRHGQDRESFLPFKLVIIELELDGDNLIGGGVPEVALLAKYPSCGILSVHLLALTFDEDLREDAKRQLTDEEIEEFTEAAGHRWQSHNYQKEILGETMGDCLEH